MKEKDKIIEELTSAVDSLLKGKPCTTVDIPDDFPDNEVRRHAEKVNELIENTSDCTRSALALSRGELSSDISGGRMGIHGALKNLQANLRHLTWKTERIAGGDFDQTVDFMGEFSESFNSMTRQLKEAFETIDSQRKELQKNEDEMNRDLRLAGILQKNFITGRTTIPGVEVHTVYKPVIEIGGDIYSFTEFRSRDRFGIFIADVNGHGVHAALLTGMLKVLVNAAGEMREDPARLLLHLNSRIIELNLDIYFTALYGICDVKKKTFLYARGGHNPPWIIRKDGEITVPVSDGPMLGVMEDISVSEKEIALMRGDKILCYTDGLTEAEGAGGGYFEDIIDSVLDRYKNMDITDYVNSIYSSLADFHGSEKFSDDVCMAGIEITED